MTFLEKVKKGLVIFDGGFGTMIQPHMQLGELPELLNLRLPEEVQAVHAAYYAAGSDVVETNTLNANRRKVEKTGHTVEEVVTAAVKNARRAADACGREAYVALSMGSTGVMLEPLGDMSFDEACDIYSEMAAAGTKAGCDLILIETVSDLHEIKAAIMGAKKAANLPVAVTVTFMENGRLLTGADVRTTVVTLESLGADIIGMNCGLGPKQMLGLADQLCACASAPVLINPNAGLPKVVDGVTTYTVAPDEFAADAAKLVEKGTRLIGGCCGTTPAHISALKAVVSGMEITEPSDKGIVAITSGSRCAVLENGAEICDITADDEDDMLDNAMDTEADAVKIACENLAEAASYIQETMLKPMYLCGEPADVRAAARAYNGRPMIGVATSDTLDEFIAIAKETGALLTVESEALIDIAANELGEKNVLVDLGDSLADNMGVEAATIVTE